MTGKDNVMTPCGDLVRCFLTHELKNFFLISEKRFSHLDKLLSSSLADED